MDDNSSILSSERMLGGFDYEPTVSTSTYIPSNMSMSDRLGKPKNTSITDKLAALDLVFIVVNYGPKSHALFGDFNGKFASFKEKFLTKQRWLMDNPRLSICPGWTLFKDKLGELCGALTMHDIKFKKVEPKEFENEVLNSTIARIDAETKNASIKARKELQKSSFAVLTQNPKKITKENRKKVKKYGNIYEQSTGLVFETINIEGKDVSLVVGSQNTKPEKGKTRWDTINHLTPGLREEAKERGYTCFDEETIKNLKDKKLADKLQKLLEKEKEEDDPLGTISSVSSVEGSTSSEDL